MVEILSKYFATVQVSLKALVFFLTLKVVYASDKPIQQVKRLQWIALT